MMRSTVAGSPWAWAKVKVAPSAMASAHDLSNGFISFPVKLSAITYSMNGFGVPALRGFIVAALAVTTSGCHPNYEPMLAGDWKVDMTRSKIATASTSPAERQRAWTAYRAFGLQLERDHSFSANLFLPVRGMWVLSG